jgi:phenylalanyl-tRNA synthetase beta chain
MNNSLTRAPYYNNDLFDEKSIVRILNPLSQDLGVMRRTLFFGGMETLAWNQNRRVQDLKIFEFGNIYIQEPEKEKPRPHKLPGYREQRVLDIFMSGHMQSESWNQPQRPVSLFDLKAEVMHLLKRMNIPMEDAALQEIHSEGFMETGLRYTINGKHLMELGEVSRKFCKSFDLKQEVFYATINWELVLQLLDRKPIVFKEIPRFPEVRRDLALLLAKDVRFEDIEVLARRTERKLLRNVRLFDIYTDEKMGKDVKSYAVSFTLQDETKTLTDKEIDKVMEKIMATLKKELNAAVR